ncbi:MAG: ABC transporter substrate-binding protein [Deltaproteobacteria bacterium]|nr:ABC transporter substrate-binding protein [Deltaproteobacteria bacterium]
MSILLQGKTALGTSITVLDSMGRKIEVSLPIKRIVALNSDVLEVLRTLKAQDLVVGVFSEIVRNRDFWGDLAQKSRVGSWREANIEAIVALHPDIVVAYSRNPGPELEKKMAPFGVKVLRLDFYKEDTLEREVMTMGRLLGREKEARRFCDWHKLHLDKLIKRLGLVKKRTSVYIENYTDYHTVAPGSGGHDMCTLAGGRNIASGFSIPYPRVTPEWVVSQNPDVIVKAAAWGGGYSLKTPAVFNRQKEEIMKRPAWQHIAAVAYGRVHVMDSAIWTGPRAIIGMAYLARWFYPKLFPDLDPKAWHREYIEIFQGISYRGVYVSSGFQETGK